VQDKTVGEAHCESILSSDYHNWGGLKSNIGSGGDSRKEDTHKLRKEVKAESLPNEINLDKQLLKEQAKSTVNKTLKILCP